MILPPRSENDFDPDGPYFEGYTVGQAEALGLILYSAGWRIVGATDRGDHRYMRMLAIRHTRGLECYKL